MPKFPALVDRRRSIVPRGSLACGPSIIAAVPRDPIFDAPRGTFGTSRTSGPPIATRDPPDPSDRPRSPRIRAYRFVSYRPAASDRSRALSQPDIVSVWKIA